MITIQKFGTLPNGESVEAYTLRAPNGGRATLLSYGARLQSLCLPDGQDIVLGFDDLPSYITDEAYIGAAIGRVSNRIQNANFTIDGHHYDIGRNEGRHALHGGPNGFDRVNWKVEIEGDSLIFRHNSAHDHQGYPGAVKCEFRYALDDNGLRLDMRAVTDKATPISLTAHSYFNLGETDIRNHALSIKAQSYLKTDSDGIPISQHTIENSPFDFKASRKVEATEIDHHFNVAGTGMRKMADLFSPQGNIRLTILSDLPGLQIYTASQMQSLTGKSRQAYGPFSGIAFEPQFPPNAINSDDNSKDKEAVILRPNKVWTHSIIYKIESLTL